MTQSQSPKILIYITYPELEGAKKLASALVESKLCACVNIIPKIFSVYRWLDKTESSEECVLLCKAQKNKFSQISDLVNDEHPYDTPAIFSISLDELDPEYEKWISYQLL